MKNRALTDFASALAAIIVLSLIMGLMDGYDERRNDEQALREAVQAARIADAERKREIRNDMAMYAEVLGK